MVDFKRKSMELEINHTNTVKNLDSLVLGVISGVGWESGGKLDRENYGFEVGTSKLVNNSTTSLPNMGSVPNFLKVEASSLSFQKICSSGPTPLFS
jgi:hypothetical protein